MTLNIMCVLLPHTCEVNLIYLHILQQVFINGLSNSETREWFKSNSGYVMQLATPYYEELTVRENLTFSALMRLPKTMSIKNKLMRVEQVIGQVRLLVAKVR